MVQPDVPTVFDVVSTSIKPDKVDSTQGEYRELFSSNSNVENRKANYEKMVNAYYDLITDFYEYGWGQSFHFAPRTKAETFEQSIMRHELLLALKMNMNKSGHYLDIGSGVGGPQRNLATFTGAKITGFNNNAYQISRGKRHTQNMRLESLCDFVKGDFMKMPFEDNTFDGCYAIEATCHAPDKVACYKEILRIMKPGATFCSYEWAMTGKYDPTNKYHQRIKHDIEIGDSLPNLESPSEILEAFKAAGFEVLEFSDLVDNRNHMIPWYATLQGGFSLANFRHTTWGRWLTHQACSWSEYLKVLPKGTTDVHSILLQAADSLVQGGVEEIFTPMLLAVVRKPLA